MTADPSPGGTTGTPTAPPPSASLSGHAGGDDVALFVRRLLDCARSLFVAVPEAGRAPLFAAIDSALDAFLTTPAPATFLAAFRALDQARRRLLIERAGSGVLQRGFEDGLAALRRVSSLPVPALEVLARHLPADARAGARLHALAALAGTYQELSARVAADTDRRRRLWKTFPRRRTRR